MLFSHRTMINVFEKQTAFNMFSIYMHVRVERFTRYLVQFRSLSRCAFDRGNIKVKPMNKPSITDVCFSFVCVGSMKCSLKSKNQSEYPFIIISKIDINIHLWNEYIVNCNIGSS